MPSSRSAVATTVGPPSERPALEWRETVPIAIDSLRHGPSLRERGIDAAHVAALAEVVDSWPPIVVSRADRSIIDGQHRVAAARKLGLRELCAVLFDGSPDDAYIEFVRCNVGHGLPLTLAERRHAVRHILCVRPELSDRGIASVCGVSPKTVARLRHGSTAGAGHASGAEKARARIGRDGRVRPLDAAAARARIADEVKRQPEASLRAIARLVGASPETVRSVRNEVRGRSGSQSAPTSEPVDCEATVLGLRSRQRPTGAPLRADRAFTDRDGGDTFVEWFDATSIERIDLWQQIEWVPLSRIYEIADEARRRAAFWTQFAVTLEGRVRRRA